MKIIKVLEKEIKRNDGRSFKIRYVLLDDNKWYNAKLTQLGWKLDLIPSPRGNGKRIYEKIKGDKSK